MTALLLKSTAAILAALLLVAATRRGRASLRHLILAALFVFLLLLPLVQRLAPSLDIPLLDAPPAAAAAPQVALAPVAIASTVPDAVAPVSRPFDWLALATKIYLTVAGLLLAWLALGVVRLQKLASGAESWLEGTQRLNEIAYETLTFRAALVVLSSEVAAPLTFGFRRSIVVLPYAARSWSADELTRALRHELEHVRREDWLLQLAARAACALYWPHPLVWMAWRRFCLEAERACDDAVIGVSEPVAYAGQLVSLARHVRGGMNSVPALGMASRSRLAQRIDAILDPLQRRGPHGGFAAAAVLTALLVLLVCVAPARLIAAVTDSGQQTSFNPDPDMNFDVDPSPEISPYAQVLVEAAQAGDMADVRRLIKRIDVNTVAPGDGTALIGAARGGQAEVVDFLLDNNADPNLPSPGDANPLIAAACAGHGDIVVRLLDAGANIDEIVPGDENALMQAVWHGHADVVQLLLARGANVNARAYERDELRTPLRLARKGGHEEIEQILLAAGASE
jgi:beta-lactamase regulating signal transducer with metallopeptidase domain